MTTTAPFTDWAEIAARIAAANRPAIGNHITLHTVIDDYGVEVMTHLSIDGVHVDIADDDPLVVSRQEGGLMLVTATMFAGQLSTETVPVR